MLGNIIFFINEIKDSPCNVPLYSNFHFLILFGRYLFFWSSFLRVLVYLLRLIQSIISFHIILHRDPLVIFILLINQLLFHIWLWLLSLIFIIETISVFVSYVHLFWGDILRRCLSFVHSKRSFIKVWTSGKLGYVGGRPVTILVHVGGLFGSLRLDWGKMINALLRVGTFSHLSFEWLDRISCALLGTSIFLEAALLKCIGFKIIVRICRATVPKSWRGVWVDLFWSFMEFSFIQIYRWSRKKHASLPHLKTKIK